MLSHSWLVYIGLPAQPSVSPPPTSSGPRCSLQLSALLASAAQPFWRKALLSLTIRETTLNHCKESPETQTKALEALQAVTELPVVVLVEEALPVVDRLDTPPAILSAVNLATELLLHLLLGARMDLPAVVDPAEGLGEATEEVVAPPVVDRLDTPVAIPSAVNLAMELLLHLLLRARMDLPAAVDPTEPKLVIRGGGEGEAGTEGRAGGTEEREGTGGREGETGMEGA